MQSLARGRSAPLPLILRREVIVGPVPGTRQGPDLARAPGRHFRRALSLLRLSLIQKRPCGAYTGQGMCL